MNRTFKYLLAVCGTAYLISYLCLALLRIRYPYELEWMEGGMVEHVARILAGEKLYVQPSADFIAFIYPPLYFYIAALAAKLTGVGFAPLRLVSFVSSIGSLFVIFLFVKRETGDRLAAGLAACLFAATYRLSGAWMDIARNDSLCLFLLLWSIYIIRFHETARWYILAGALAALAFLTKQIALAAVLPTMLYSAFSDRRRSVPFIATAIALTAASYFVLDMIHGGFYRYYTIDLPRHHAFVKTYMLSFWTNDLALPFSIALVLAVLYLFAQHVHGRRPEFLFYLCGAVGMVGASWISKVHMGSYSNSLFPAHAIVAVLFGLGLHTARELVRREPLNRYPFAETFLFIICIIQFAGLVYNPFGQLPSAADRRAGRTLVETVSRIGGDVLIPFHPYYATLAGKRSCMHHMALRDVLRGGNCLNREELVKDIEERLRSRSYDAVILDTDEWDFIDGVELNYVGPDTLITDEDALYPVTGTRLRPSWIWHTMGTESEPQDRLSPP